jgi:murein DD-endopeptidase MepM/ murein hydrolase activator NlpD
VLVTVRGGAEAPTGTLAGRPLQFHAVPGGHQALAALPVELSPGELEVTVVPAGGAPLQSSLRVEDPKWRTRELKVAREFTEPSPELKARMDEDRAAFARAFAQPPGAPLFSGEFAWPRKAALTGRFGDRRTFNGQTQTQHYGLDIDGDEGDPIATANDGVVVMVRECFASGNTVVVHHGAGLYTAYFHLTEFRVQEGQRVARGEVVGTLGKTGRVTGAHLHWSVKVGELYVNPESLMRLRFF